jgi:hypothetical protein
MRLLGVKTKSFPHGSPSERHRITQKDRRRLYRSLCRKLTKDNVYREVFNPYEVDNEDPIIAALGDDLTDIYNDVKEGLDLFVQGDRKHVHDAVWLWRFHFLIHTGHHCASAMRPLHVLIERYHEML